MTYDQWLQEVALESTETTPDNDIRMIFITNQMAMKNEFKPEGWFNPFELTEQQIDEMRQDFKGSGYKWMQYVESKLPNLDSRVERKLKTELTNYDDTKRCGSEITWIDKKGLPHKGIYHCKHYDICGSCQRNKEHEHFERLMKMDGCKTVENQRVEMIARYGVEAVYSFKLQDGREVSVVSTDDNIGQEMTYEVAKSMSKIAVTGNRVSGELGATKKTKEDEPKELDTVTVPTVILEATKEVKEQVEIEFMNETKNLNPQTVEEVVSAIVECNRIWLKIAHRHCDKIHFIGKKQLIITELDLDWSDRPEMIKDRLNARFKQELSG